MLKAHIKPGTDYALRERRGPDATIQRVRVLEHIRGSKWKAAWVHPNPGLVHFVDSAHLLVPWKEIKPFLKEEQDETYLIEQNDRDGYRQDSSVVHAVEQVFDTVGSDISFYNGVLSGSPEAIELFKTRAGCSASPHSPVGFKRRDGTLSLPFSDALRMAREFCAVEPTTVLVNVETTERKWNHDAQRGDGSILPLLNSYRAAWALIRQWTGHDPAVALREAEIQRLERLVWDAVYVLQKAGLDRESTRLRRAVERT